MGPKVRKMLAAVSDQLALSVDLGMFSIIAKGLLWLLEFFQQYTHNWGLSIIMLTIVIKAVFWPLTAKSYSSMEKMKKLQPMMASIREKYKDNKEAMNKEVMALYKTYGVNPRQRLCAHPGAAARVLRSVSGAADLHRAASCALHHLSARHGPRSGWLTCPPRTPITSRPSSWASPCSCSRG